MKPKRCRECRGPMELCTGGTSWMCFRGDCYGTNEVPDRMRARRWRRRYVAHFRRMRLLGIRAAQRLGVKRPVVSMPWPWRREFLQPHDVAVETMERIVIWRPPGEAVYHFIGGHYRSSEGAACLHCDPGKNCPLHEVPF